MKSGILAGITAIALASGGTAFADNTMKESVASDREQQQQKHEEKKPSQPELPTWYEAGSAVSYGQTFSGTAYGRLESVRVGTNRLRLDTSILAQMPVDGNRFGMITGTLGYAWGSRGELKCGAIWSSAGTLCYDSYSISERVVLEGDKFRNYTGGEWKYSAYTPAGSMGVLKASFYAMPWVNKGPAASLSATYEGAVGKHWGVGFDFDVLTGDETPPFLEGQGDPDKFAGYGHVGARVRYKDWVVQPTLTTRDVDGDGDLDYQIGVRLSHEKKFSMPKPE